MLLFTWGKAWITVSSRALIPVAIFNSFSTGTQQWFNISSTSSLCVCVCECISVCANLLLSLGLAWFVWWWGWWVGKRSDLFPPEWFPWWTATRWRGPIGSTLKQTHSFNSISCGRALWFAGVFSHARAWIPFLEEAPQTESDEFENGLDDKNDGEDVIAVLQHLLEVLRYTEKHVSNTRPVCTVV